MIDKTHTLGLSQAELSVIEAALHTQSKILGVQAGAGGSAALARLNEVKQVLAVIAQQKPVEKKPCKSRGLRCWFGMSRIFG